MYVNKTGEIFESKISNGRASFYYNPEETNSNQKVLFSFNKADFASKKAANSKSLDFMLINKTDRKNKKAERTFNINLMDVFHNVIDKIELVNIDELSAKDDFFICEHHFNVHTSSEYIDKIQWGYFTIPLNQLNILYDKDKILNCKEIEYINTGDYFHFTPSSIFNEEKRKQLHQNQEIVIVAAIYNKSLIFLKGLKGYNFYIIFPDKKPIFNKLYLSEKYTSYYGRSLYVINVENEAEYLYNKDPELCLKGNPKDDNIKKLYTFGIKIEADNYDNNFNHFSYGIAGLKWLKITIRTDLKSNYKKEDDNNREIWELSLKEACKEIIDKYKNNPLDIDFASFSTDKIEVTGNVSVIAATEYISKSVSEIKEAYQRKIIYNKVKNIYYYVLNNSEQECAVILCPFVERAVLEQGKYIQLGFDAVDVANYMAGEIENNLKSSVAQDIIRFSNPFYDMIPLYGTAQPYFLFYEAVKTDSFWDHKWQLSALFPSMGLSRRYHHVYIDKEIPYDVWSNIDFGVAGKYCRFSENTLLDGADLAQKESNHSFTKGDTQCDKAAIKIGFSIYDKYVKGSFINAYDILSYIVGNDLLKYYFQNGECPDE
ncbi:polymorphic toxin type 44 domain-containing protein [Mucispirillum schaedleri]|uniref:Bacterial toxin 44 domain-containing protein n=4 Tax=Mucispirillum TaxID=248038 RepID=A0AA97LND6_9BACT|nr:polymorphic toxin type 44 domain-containing protein [Mucispirillum schaedleri]USF23627.1 hypothetical protein N508_000692 [Mucispirillum schaedleri ASF457]